VSQLLAICGVVVIAIFIASGLHWAAIALFTIAFIVFRVCAKIFAVGRHLINLKLINSLIKKFKYGSFNQ
jgi:hypothetical protein